MTIFSRFRSWLFKDFVTNEQLKSHLNFPEFHLSDFEWDEFYGRFENRFRGEPAFIERRLRDRYTGLLEEVKQDAGPGKIIDLGCGRGELLTLGRELGLEVVGVDSSIDAVKAARHLKHEVHHADILDFLKAQPCESVIAVSCLQVIEHLPIRYTWRVFREAYRILKKNGAFFAETPSCFSAWISSRQFYLDPTHNRPIHPDLIQFMAADIGFLETHLLEFNPVELGDKKMDLSSSFQGKAQEEMKKLEGWLFGPMDVTLWARKR
ncbi:MAG: methyltransferase domain-containing protein [Oligoflexales bacterium]|nr:methyltransferase domain-containing protein [Oligoflexales bacterium]